MRSFTTPASTPPFRCEWFEDDGSTTTQWFEHADSAMRLCKGASHRSRLTDERTGETLHDSTAAD